MDPQTAVEISSLTLALIAGALLVAWSGRFQLAQYAASSGTFNPESNARGIRLLKDWLSPEQRACYQQHRYFEVIGSDTATVYRIHHDTRANVEQLDRSGRSVCRWCFVPEGDLVAGDVMLAQKIALETNESGALAVANRFAGTFRRRV